MVFSFITSEILSLSLLSVLAINIIELSHRTCNLRKRQVWTPMIRSVMVPLDDLAFEPWTLLSVRYDQLTPNGVQVGVVCHCQSFFSRYLSCGCVSHTWPHSILGLRSVDTKAAVLFIQSADWSVATIMGSDKYVLNVSITSTRI